MKTKALILGILIVGLLPILRCSAQQTDSANQEIITDRPDQNESTVTVPLKSFQIETGFADEFNHSVTTLSNGTLFRYGLLENFELRLETELLQIYSNDISTGGLSPVRIGMKMHIANQHGISPDFGFIASLGINKLASKNFQTSYTAPVLNFVFNNDLSNTFSLGYNMGMAWDGETANPDYFYTLSLGIDFTENLDGFAETYGFFEAKNKPDYRMDAGLAFKIKPLLQFDVSGGLGITANAPQGFISTGISYRI